MTMLATALSTGIQQIRAEVSLALHLRASDRSSGLARSQGR